MTTFDYASRHHAAMTNPRPGFEKALVTLAQGLELYAAAHQARYTSPIGDDGVLGDEWATIARAVIGLLNGEAGRIDCGTFESMIRTIAAANGFDRDLTEGK